MIVWFVGDFGCSLSLDVCMVCFAGDGVVLGGLCLCELVWYSFAGLLVILGFMVVL